jgi:hypothetical protein
MTMVELARLVAEVREAQKAYFRTRSAAALESSKAMEKRLDRVVMEILVAPTLFGDGRRG